MQNKSNQDEAKKQRLKELEAAEKAEVWQSIKALYIPFSLFIATCIFSAGGFLVWHGEPAGWGFIALTGIIAISAFVALFGFQNKYRAKGIVGTQDTEMVRGEEKI